MKDKLELKDIATYLSHKISVIHDCTVKELHGIINESVYLSYNDIGTDMIEKDLDEITLLLRPLSDLTEEIEHNGEKFVPIEWLDANIKPTKHKSPSVSFTDGYVEMTYYHEYQKLFEWHFDVFGLIEKGLAIDINTIK